MLNNGTSLFLGSLRFQFTTQLLKVILKIFHISPLKSDIHVAREVVDKIRELETSLLTYRSKENQENVKSENSVV